MLDRSPTLPSPSASDLVRARRAGMQRAAIAVAFVFAVMGLARWYISWNSEQYSLKANARVRIDVNQDAESTIELLPHVGAMLAKRIVAEREQRGPFVDLGDLTRRVPGIGPKIAEVLRDHVAFSSTWEK